MLVRARVASDSTLVSHVEGLGPRGGAVAFGCCSRLCAADPLCGSAAAIRRGLLPVVLDIDSTLDPEVHSENKAGAAATASRRGSGSDPITAVRSPQTASRCRSCLRRRQRRGKHHRQHRGPPSTCSDAAIEQLPRAVAAADTARAAGPPAPRQDSDS